MTKIGKKLAAILLAVAMVMTFMPILGTQTAYAAGTLSELDLYYDISALNFNTDSKESEIRELAIATISSTTEGVEVHHNSNSDLCRWNSDIGEWSFTLGSEEYIADGVDYAIMFGIAEINVDGYTFPDSVKVYSLDTLGNLSDIADLTVRVNGEKLDSAQFFYSTDWNMLCVFVPIGKPAAGVPVRNVSVEPASVVAGTGTTQQFTAAVNGSAADKSVIWSVTGAASADTMISSDGLLTIGENETATQLTVRAAATADPSVYGESLVTVKDLKLSSLDLFYDMNVLAFNTGSKEAKVRELAIANISSTTEGVEVHHNSNSDLCRWNSDIGEWSFTLGSEEYIADGVDYAIMFGIAEINVDGYTFPDSVKVYSLDTLGNLSDIADLTVRVNGEKLDSAQFFYSTDWNMLCVFVPIGKPARLDISKASVTGVISKTYTGKALMQSPVVKFGGTTLKLDTDYTLSYKNNKNAGKNASVTINGKGRYTGTITRTFTINKAANPLKISTKTATVKYSKLKKKNQTLVVTKVITFTKKGQGTMTYTKASGNKKITVAKTGKVTVKKGLKKGTYKVKIKVKAAGNANYKPSAVKTLTIKIKVK